MNRGTPSRILAPPLLSSIQRPKPQSEKDVESPFYSIRASRNPASREAWESDM
jgi:hypothetical protein